MHWQLTPLVTLDALSVGLAIPSTDVINKSISRYSAGAIEKSDQEFFKYWTASLSSVAFGEGTSEILAVPG